MSADAYCSFLARLSKIGVMVSPYPAMASPFMLNGTSYRVTLLRRSPSCKVANGSSVPRSASQSEKSLVSFVEQFFYCDIPADFRH